MDEKIEAIVGTLLDAMPPGQIGSKPIEFIAMRANAAAALLQAQSLAKIARSLETLTAIAVAKANEE